MHKSDFEKMAEASVALPENARLSAVLNSGKDLSLMFLGGSVTAGYVPNRMVGDCYPKLVKDFCENEYGKDRAVSFENFGTGSFSSELGIITAAKELGRVSPNIVFVEFAVNNGFDKYWADNYESLVRMILNSKNAPAVVIVNAYCNAGYTAEPYMKEIADYYSIPSVSVKSMTEYMSANGAPWSEYSDDTVHPNENGHLMICECIKHIFRLAGKNGVPAPVPQKCCYGNTFETLKFYDEKNLPIISAGAFSEAQGGIVFDSGWRYSPKEKAAEDGDFEFRVDSDYLYIVYEIDCRQDERAKAEIIINGKTAETLDGYSIYGWNNPAVKYIPLPRRGSTVKIKIRKENMNKSFRLFGFGY